MSTSPSNTAGRRRGTATRTNLIAFAIVAAACVGVTTPAHGATVTFNAVIDGVQETPPTGSPALATGTFTMDTAADTLSIMVTILAPLLAPEIGAHIHGYAPPGVPAGILFGLPPGSPKVAVWPFAPADEALIIAGLSYVNIHSALFPAGEIRGQILRVPSCGDGILDSPGEQCDDGNTDDDDCCSSICQFESSGGPCEGTNLCNNGQCDGAGTCVPAIRTGCRAAGKSILLIKNPPDGDKDKLVWKWLKGDETFLADFGSPTTTTEYALCVYAGTSAAAIMDAEIAPSAMWAPAGTTGLMYKDPDGTSDGIRKVILKSGDAGKAKTLVKGKGADLPDVPAGPFTLPVTAQLVNSDNSVCFEGLYADLPGVIIKNELEQFKAKAQ